METLTLTKGLTKYLKTKTYKQIIVTSLQGSNPPFTNLITHPRCSDVTSQLFSRKGGGAPDVKNPDPYY